MSQNESNTRAAAAASESADTVSPGTPSMSPTTQQVTAGLARRYAAEKRFRFYGMFAIAATLSFLAVLLISIVSKGLPAFTQTYMQLDVPLELSTLGIDQQTVDGVLDGSISAQTIRRANYNGAIREAMRERFPEVEGRSALRDLFKLVSKGAEFESRALKINRLPGAPSLQPLANSMCALTPRFSRTAIHESRNLPAFAQLWLARPTPC